MICCAEHLAVFVIKFINNMMEVSSSQKRSVLRFQWKCTTSDTWEVFRWKFFINFFITPLQKPCLAGEVARCRRSCGNQEVGYSHIFWYMVYFRIRHYKEHWKILRIRMSFEFCTLYLGNSHHKKHLVFWIRRWNTKRGWLDVGCFLNLLITA